MIAIAACLLLMEVKFTSHGFLALPGAVLLASGIYLLVDSPDPAVHISAGLAIGLVLPVALLTAFLVTIAARAARSKFALGPHSLVGRTGTVIASPHLRVKVAGEYWNAASQEILAPGARVKVEDVHGLELSVTAVHDKIRTT